MSSAQLAKPSRKQRVRTLWISDVHLGTKDCQAEHLAQFLKRYQADKVYLVGDIIDGWRLRSGIFWPQAHTNVIRRLLTMSKRGTEVVYVTGNHEEFLRGYSKPSTSPPTAAVCWWCTAISSTSLPATTAGWLF